MSKTYTTKVYHENTDCYGIAHHSAYVKWVEASRNEYFERFFCNFRELDDLGIKVLISEMACQFKKPVFLMDEINVYTEIIQLQKHSISFEHIIKNNKNNKNKNNNNNNNNSSIVFKGTSKVICTDKNNKLLKRLPDYIYNKMIKLIKKEK